MAFFWFCVAASATLPAWDLTASFVAGRLLANGRTTEIYYQLHQTPGPLANPVWVGVARAGGIGDGQTTPYVQTPLWAWLVAPLARAVDFRAFRQIFAGVMALCMAGVVGLGARRWAPSCAGPGAQGVLLLALVLTVPFSQSLVLGQTHAVFLLLSVLAILAGLGGREVSAGALLALAACVKISPGWLAVAWLAAGCWRAAASFALCSALLAGLTVLAVGPGLFGAYLAQLRAYGHGILLAFNNESLAAVLLSVLYPAGIAFQPGPVRLPEWVSLVCLACLAGSALAGGWLERRAAGGPMAGLGLLGVLVAATAFSPLAWNHYFIVLILPAMVFVDAWRRGKGRVWLGLAVLVWGLCVWPVAGTLDGSVVAAGLRSVFWAAVVCLVGQGRMFFFEKKNQKTFAP